VRRTGGGGFGAEAGVVVVHGVHSGPVLVLKSGAQPGVVLTPGIEVLKPSYRSSAVPGPGPDGHDLPVTTSVSWPPA
jgi:hypothetical protein